MWLVVNANIYQWTLMAFCLRSCKRLFERFLEREQVILLILLKPVMATAAAPEFEDRTWREVDIPHDWAVELPFSAEAGSHSHGYKTIGWKYPETSIGWYRKRFQIPASDLGKKDQYSVRRHSSQFNGLDKRLLCGKRAKWLCFFSL